MTNHERAERIRDWLNNRWRPTYPDEVKGEIDWITSQLDEAVREALKKDEVVRVINLAGRDIENFDDGFASAREKAAGIAASKSIEGWDETQRTKELIAERIRAMEPDK